ncbi:hypothetical protein Q8A67_013307 [Cirrhinus molitorella]|uniref:Uncharacterized protein n=1 Tax=Cirrhinus molitorella TaxID=172907 RepID=A0AA88PMG7_9TELE|nr:hypothetical protein Q8A67_016855 [Cirrhinus molitorella]KAK2890664.1 hypothetical protein Q8A67_013307 [Cirrhinus molitorella]
MQGLGALGERVRRPFGRTPVLSRSALRTGPEAGYPRPLGGFGAKGIVTSRRDSDLEAFSHNPADGSFAPVAPQPSARTKCLNLRFLSCTAPVKLPTCHCPRGRSRPGPDPRPPRREEAGAPRGLDARSTGPAGGSPPCLTGARLESSSTGSSFPADFAKPVPLAVVSLDSNRIPLVRTSSKPAARRRPRRRAGGAPAPLPRVRPGGLPPGGETEVPTRAVAGAIREKGPGARPESPPQSSAGDPPATPRAPRELPAGGKPGARRFAPAGAPPRAPPRGRTARGFATDRRPAAGPAPPWRRGASGAGGRAGGRLGAAAPPAAAGPSHASRPSPTGPALRANPCPEVTDLTCRLPLLALFQHARGCSPWRPAADMGTARRETYTFSPGFSRADESSPDAAGTAALSRARAPISGRTHSRAPCPSQRKENSPRGPRQLLRVRLRRRTGRLAAPVSATPGSGIWTRFPFDRPGTTKRIAPASERRSPIP